jgi:ferredoxin
VGVVSTIPEKCKRCGLCFKACPSEAIRWEKKQVAEIIPEKCTRCMSCYRACPFDAID